MSDDLRNNVSESGAIGEYRASRKLVIDWNRSVPAWRMISQSAYLATRFSHVLLCLLGIGLTSLGWSIASIAFRPDFNRDVVRNPGLRSNSDGVQLLPYSGELQNSVRGWLLAPDKNSNSVDLTTQFTHPLFNGGVLAREHSNESLSLRLLSWDTMLAPYYYARNIVLQMPRCDTLRGAAFNLFVVFWSIGVWGFVGGFVARRTLMELGVRTTVGWGPTFALVSSRWRSILWLVLMPWAYYLLVLTVPAFIGLIGRMGEVGQIIALLLCFPCILVISQIGPTIVSSILGFPIAVCAIVAEKKGDAFDGLSRSLAYLIPRMATVLTLLVASGLVGAFTYWFYWLSWQVGIYLFVEALSFGFGKSFFDVGMLEFNPSLGASSSTAAYLSRALFLVLTHLPLAFLFCYFWTTSAAFYLLLRYEIDHTEFDDLDLQELGEPIRMPEVPPA